MPATEITPTPNICPVDERNSHGNRFTLPRLKSLLYGAYFGYSLVATALPHSSPNSSFIVRTAHSTSASISLGGILSPILPA